MPLIIRGNVMQSRGRVDWLPDANAAQPAMTFVSDPDTGIYHPGENQLALVTGGADRLVVHDLGTTITGNVSATGFVGNAHQLEHIQVENIDGLTTALEDITNNSVTTNVLTINGSTTAGGHILPAANVTYDLGAPSARFRDLFLSGTSIALGDATITEVGGNVVIQNLDVGTIRGDGSQLTGLSAPLTLSSVQITDAEWNAIDDTALTSNVGGYCVLTGTNFAPGSIAVVGGTNASATSYVSSTQLRVHAPAKASGSYTLSVIRSGDGASASLPSSVTYSEGITWITGSQLGNVDGDVAFSIPIQATSDSTVSYANVSPLPPTTTLNPMTGNLEGTITGVRDTTTYSFDLQATDLEYQDAVRSFILRCLGIWVTQIAGTNHTLALSNRGGLVGWGYNAYGQTGVGNTTTPVTLPVDITDKGSLAGRTITVVAGGGVYSAALTSDGVVHCWGYNSNAQCGQNNTFTPQLVPVVVGGALVGQTVTAISCGRDHTLAIAGGTVYAWGYNAQGQIGNGGTSDALTPVAVTGGSLSGKTVVQVRGGDSHSMALASDGSVHMWGFRAQGQIPGGASGNQTTPADVSGYGALAGKTVVDIQTGYYHSLVLCSDNSVISWGSNSNGEAGVGNTTTPQNTPQDITNNGSLSGKTVSQIFVGMLANTSFAIASDGSIHAWGRGVNGAIGDGGVADRTLPINISSYGALAGEPISRLGGGLASVFAMRDDEHTVTAWGDNAHYQLGDATTTNRTTPVDVTTNIIAVLDA